MPIYVAPKLPDIHMYDIIMWNIKTLVIIFLQKILILQICVSFWLHSCCREWEDWTRKLVNHTSWVAVVTLTDPPKLVCNRCVTFFWLFVLSLCTFDISVGIGAFVIGRSQISSFSLFMFILYTIDFHISPLPQTDMVSQMGTLKGQDPEQNYYISSSNCSKGWTLPKDGDQTKIKVCLRNTMPPVATESEKAIFSTKVKVKVTRSLTLVSFDLGIICKGIISWVCMPNMKPLSLTIQKF